jgi:hypothetical protein
MKILVSGSRYLSDPQLIRSVFEGVFKEYPKGTLIHGGAKGVDRFVGELAKEAGYEVIECKANWEKYGKGAGMIRNQEMVDNYSPDLLIAFPIKESRGTFHTIKYAEKKGIETRVYLMNSDEINEEIKLKTKHTKSSLGKMKIDELREIAVDKGMTRENANSYISGSRDRNKKTLIDWILSTN